MFRRLAIITLMNASLFTASAPYAATITAATIQADAGDTNVPLAISITSESDEDVSSLQFDLVFDGAWLTVNDVEAGAAANAASKDVNFSVLDANTVRIVIAGFNQMMIPDGELAIPAYDVATGTPTEEYSVMVDNVLLSDPFGFPVMGDADHGAIIVQGMIEEGSGEGSGEGAGEGEGESEGMTEGEGEGDGDPMMMDCSNAPSNASASRAPVDGFLLTLMLLILWTSRNWRLAQEPSS